MTTVEGQSLEQYTRKNVSLCGAVDLLAAIFKRDQDELRARYGLPLLKPPCLTCGKPTQKISGFCSLKCHREYNWVTVVCDECGNLFKRRQSDVVYNLGKKGQQHMFCSRKCMGRRAGRDYGFVAHPENRGYRQRKWDYSKVYRLQDETGWSAAKLGRVLGIPYPTVYDILQKREEQAK